LLTCFDLFAGCGGLSLGLRQAGLDVRWANEIDSNAAATFRSAHPECRVFDEDIVDLRKRLLDGPPDLPKPGEVDVVSGGPPCQGFSGYNRFRRSSDPRNSLIEIFLDIVAYLRPRYVLMENVPGMLSLDHGRVPSLLLSALESLEPGYDAHLGILQAGYHGLPQNRWRVFILASATGSTLPAFPLPQYSFPRTTIFGATAFRANVVRLPNSDANTFWPPRPTVTVHDAISDLPEILNGGGEDESSYTAPPESCYQTEMRRCATKLYDHRCARLDELMYARCVAVPKRAGAGWLDLPEHLKPKNLARHGDSRYNNRFGRLHWGGSFNTILTRAFPYWGAVFHPEQDRVISVRESARAQGIPDSVRLMGPLSSRYRQIGNAVPPPLACALGKEILRSDGSYCEGQDTSED
jgi:DNA (cytosine-5)-methyltransferase 1